MSSAKTSLTSVARWSTPSTPPPDARMSRAKGSPRRPPFAARVRGIVPIHLLETAALDDPRPRRERRADRLPRSTCTGRLRPADPRPAGRQRDDGGDDRGGLIAERCGLPLAPGARPPRAHRALLPGAEQILTILARETEKVAIGTFTLVATLDHPMQAAEQFAVIDNLSRGPALQTLSRGFHPGYWSSSASRRRRCSVASWRRSRSWQAGVRGRALRLRGRALAGRATACSRPRRTRRAAGRSGAAATRRPRRSRARRLRPRWTCDPFPLDEGDVWDDAGGRVPRRAPSARQGAVRRADARRLGGRHLRGGGRSEFGDALRRARCASTRARQLRPPPGLPTRGGHHARGVAPHLVMGTPQQCIEQLEMLRTRSSASTTLTFCFRMPRARRWSRRASRSSASARRSSSRSTASTRRRTTRRSRRLPLVGRQAPPPARMSQPAARRRPRPRSRGGWRSPGR